MRDDPRHTERSERTGQHWPPDGLPGLPDFEGYLSGLPIAVIATDADGACIWANEAWSRLSGIPVAEALGAGWLRALHPGDRDRIAGEWSAIAAAGEIYDGRYRFLHSDGSTRHVRGISTHLRDPDGAVTGHIGVVIDETPARDLERIAWMLTTGVEEGSRGMLPTGYGDLTALNTERTILDGVGTDLLREISGEYVDMLGSSSAVYERNGDYALGIFSAGWCLRMDAASRALCDTDDDAEALASGRWHCHESCWSNCSRQAIETGESVDIACLGGINLYSVPIEVGGEVVGAINFGYGAPPVDDDALEELAERYSLPVEELREAALAYEKRPAFVIEHAKRRLRTSALLIGEILEHRRAQEALEHQAQLLEAQRDLSEVLMETSPIGIAVVDPQGGITFANVEAERVFGLSRNEITRRTYDDPEWQIVSVSGGPFPPEDLPAARVLATGESVMDVRHGIVLSDGTVKLLSVNASPIRDADGSITAVVTAVTDITEREQTEQRVRYHEELLADMGRLASIGGWEFDPATGTGTWTDETARIHGLDSGGEADVAGGLDYYIGESRQRIERAVQRAITEGADYDLELEMVDAKGEHKWVQTIGHPDVEDGVVVRVRGSFQDITDHKRVRAELEQHREHLEHLVAARTEELVRANDELEAASAAKTDFLAAMSHELRTPLNSVIGFTGVLLSEAPGPINEEQRRQLGMASRAGRHLLTLVNDVLDLAKVDTGHIDVLNEEVGWMEVVGSAAESLRDEIEAKGLDFSVVYEDCEDDLVVTDQTRVQQILINLVGNAMKFTESGSIEVSSVCGSERASVSVTDTGPGIAPDDLSAVFDPYFQVLSHEDGKPQGAGLGLPLSRSLAELLGGGITLESAVGKGSTFTLWLPRR